MGLLAILAGDLVISTVEADIDSLGLADTWWVDLGTVESGGRGITSTLSRGMELPDVPGHSPLWAPNRHLTLAIDDDLDDTIWIEATETEHGGQRSGFCGRISISVVSPEAGGRVRVAAIA